MFYTFTNLLIAVHILDDMLYLSVIPGVAIIGVTTECDVM